MENLFTRTWQLLRANTILLMIVLFETTLMLFFRGGQLQFGFNPMMEMALYFFHLAVLGGLLYQMKKITQQPEERATLDDFLNGVGRYFQRLMTGGSVLVLIFIIGFIMSLSMSLLVAGAPDEKFTTTLAELVQAGKYEELQTQLQANPELTQSLTRWVFTFLSGLAVLGIYISTLYFWTFWVVLADMHWYAAWKMSQRSLLKHWRMMLYLGMVWLVPTGMIYASLLSGNTIISMIAFTLSLVAKAYFTLLFVRFWTLAEPELITPLEPVAETKS